MLILLDFNNFLSDSLTLNFEINESSYNLDINLIHIAEDAITIISINYA